MAKFGPTRNRSHLSMTQYEETASFSGTMTYDNKENIIKTLKSVQVRPVEVRSPIESVSTSTSREGLDYKP